MVYGDKQGSTFLILYAIKTNYINHFFDAKFLTENRLSGV